MKIACLTGSTLGGSQKAAWLYADGLARLGHEVCVVTSPGPMLENFQTRRFDIRFCANETEWESFLCSGWADVVHYHAPGYYMPQLFYRILARLPAKPFRLIETNVFGWLTNPESDRYTDYRLFISMANGAQAFRRAGYTPENAPLDAHTVVYYPVEIPAPISSETRSEIRSRLGIETSQLLVVRTGRPDARKWANWESRAFQLARRCHPELVFLQMQPPTGIESAIQAGAFGPGLLTLPMEASQKKIMQLCQTADIMLHTAKGGESFGYAIAEGMAAGLPIVTRTTPWGDNAQVELVEHGQTGFVCDSHWGAAEALCALAEDSQLRAKMGAEAQERIRRIADPLTECQLLSEIAQHGHCGPLFQARKRLFARFLATFPRLEATTLESDASEPMSNRLSRSIYRRVALARSSLSQLKARLRTFCHLPAYHA